MAQHRWHGSVGSPQHSHRLSAPGRGGATTPLDSFSGVMAGATRSESGAGGRAIARRVEDPGRDFLWSGARHDRSPQHFRHSSASLRRYPAPASASLCLNTLFYNDFLSLPHRFRSPPDFRPDAPPPRSRTSNDRKWSNRPLLRQYRISNISSGSQQFISRNQSRGRRIRIANSIAAGFHSASRPRKAGFRAIHASGLHPRIGAPYAAGHPNDRIDVLMPWACKPSST